MYAKRHRCLQPVHAVRQAVNSRRSDPDREGPPTECATSIPRNDQAVQVGWSSMSISDVGDRSAAVDLIPWYFVLRTPTDHDSQLVLWRLHATCVMRPPPIWCYCIEIRLPGNSVKIFLFDWSRFWVSASPNGSLILVHYFPYFYLLTYLQLALQIVVLGNAASDRACHGCIKLHGLDDRPDTCHELVDTIVSSSQDQRPASTTLRLSLLWRLKFLTA